VPKEKKKREEKERTGWAELDKLTSYPFLYSPGSRPTQLSVQPTWGIAHNGIAFGFWQCVNLVKTAKYRLPSRFAIFLNFHMETKASKGCEIASPSAASGIVVSASRLTNLMFGHPIWSARPSREDSEQNGKSSLISAAIRRPNTTNTVEGNPH